jgi:hypothetical protein
MPRARYYRRAVADGKCPACRATLQDSDRGRLCVECAAQAVTAANAYAATAAGKATIKARRDRRKAAGVCLDCPAPAAAPHVRCEDCHTVHKLANIASDARREEASHAAA